MNGFLLLLPLSWLVFVIGILLWYRRDLGRFWREPVLKRPVLVLESDDWGAGPSSQVAALDEIAAVLKRHRDSTGRSAVASLAVVLAVPEGRAIAAEGASYRRICLDDPPLAPVCEALKRGEADGVFSLQLHGLEHFWPQTLMHSSDEQVRAWMREPAPAMTERLPSSLQSRWTDASRLPSSPLPDPDVRRAVADEVDVYQRAIGRSPNLVVPPTFVWTLAVERAWAAHGIECVITPGLRYTSRGVDGASTADDARFANGDHAGGITYLVRYDYFEPARGRDAAYALQALSRACEEGRPCVLENHRINFCGDATARVNSLQELERLMAGALAQVPDIRFLSSSELFHLIRGRDAQWFSSNRVERLSCLVRRLRRTGRLWKLLRLTGVAQSCERLLRLAPYIPGASHA